MCVFFTENVSVFGKFRDELIEPLQIFLILIANSGSLFHGSDGSIANYINRMAIQFADLSVVLFGLLQSKLHFHRMLYIVHIIKAQDTCPVYHSLFTDCC